MSNNRSPEDFIGTGLQVDRDLISDAGLEPGQEPGIVYDIDEPGEAVTARRRISPRSPRQAIQPEPAAPPPAPSRRARHPMVIVLNFFLMTMVIVLGAVGAGLYIGKSKFDAPGPLAENRSVVIQRGATVGQIGELLKRTNVIANDYIFSGAVRLYKAEDKLKAGEYLFEPGVSMRQVMEILTSGRAILHAVTVPEGLTVLKVAERLQGDPILVGEIGPLPAEGELLPETYKFTRGATRQQMLDQMRRARNRALDDIWARRSSDLPITTKQEFVTLASIVEKETGRADERPRVASVFINRLRRGMRLQSDPTIIYGLFGGAGKPPDRPIYRSDIEKATPYNTYVIDGLPPGPIANPGRAALEAVANPSRTNDLYFVADGSGGHAFAETLDEHNRNVARWRSIEAARKAGNGANEANNANGGTAGTDGGTQ
ncbi:MAG: endolytic transglycosylase MltG [Alphaproteobacteria bacterium]